MVREQQLQETKEALSARDAEVQELKARVAELEQLQQQQAQGMVQIRPDGFSVTAQGWYFVRAVAMLFDRHLQDARRQAQFSKIL